MGHLQSTDENHVLSLSFERCENDITAIVLIPVVILTKERERERCEWIFLEILTFRK